MATIPSSPVWAGWPRSVVQQMLLHMPNRSFCGCSTEASADAHTGPKGGSPDWANRRLPTLGLEDNIYIYIYMEYIYIYIRNIINMHIIKR